MTYRLATIHPLQTTMNGQTNLVA